MTSTPLNSRFFPDVIEIKGVPHRYNAKGNLEPESVIKPQHLLEDETVRKIVGYAQDLSEQIARFKGHSFEDIGLFMSLLQGEYSETRGGQKGNMTFMSHDGLLKVTVQVADNVVFGPELHVAKVLIDECIIEWSENAREELKAIVLDAFDTDKEGKISQTKIFGLLRLDIADERWKRAMEAIRDAMRVVGSKTYLRAYRREGFDGPWKAITIDLAKA